MDKLQRKPHDEQQNIKNLVASILNEAIPTQQATDTSVLPPGVQFVGERNTIHIAVHARSSDDVAGERSWLSRAIDFMGRLVLLLSVLFAGFYGCSMALSALTGA